MTLGAKVRVNRTILVLQFYIIKWSGNATLEINYHS